MRYGIPGTGCLMICSTRRLEESLALHSIQTQSGLGQGRHFGATQERGVSSSLSRPWSTAQRENPLEGSDSLDVLWGVDFLGRVAEGEKVQLKERVIVIGGGSVAVDVALTARRCGAKDVTMICLETREEMPAHPWEVDGALKEGVKLIPSWGPHEIVKDNGRVSAVEIIIACPS